MPIYEEKLISPLAIRYTQQRIRTTFKDGREVEGTIEEITAEPGVGDYDIILKVPFPVIEIIRWSPKGRRVANGDHWFSFDNRRLYCLQRVAAKYWPKRVGAIVEVMYADSGTIKKKLDSKTGGLSVTIGHAFATADELEEWSWRQAVQQRAPPGTFALKAEAAVKADDAKVSVQDLMDAPRLSSSLEKLGTEADLKSYDSSNSETVMAEESDGSSKSESVMAKESGGENHREVTRAEEASRPEDNPLTNLIAQLLVIEAPKLPSPLEELRTEPDLKSYEPETAMAEESGGENRRKVTCVEEASQPEENPLTNLIAQLLVIKTKEHVEAHEHASDDAISTHLSESSESTDTDASMSESGGRLSPSAKSCESELVSASEGEYTAQQQLAPKACTVPAPFQKASYQNAEKKATKESSEKKVAKETRTSQVAQQYKAALMAQAAEVEMARRRLAQLQMAQWQSTQMVQWRQAAWAHQASQMAQLQAAQAADWRRV